MAHYSQRMRPVELQIEDCPTDQLLLAGIELTEEISRPFTAKLELLSSEPTIRAEDVLGRRATIRISLGSDEPRFIHGIISHFAKDGRDHTFSRYQAQVVPWIWLLSYSRDNRIFQNQTAPQIVEALLYELGFRDFRFDLTARYPTLSYCVQYRESGLNFISRLLEEFGIHYYFEHTAQIHTLILSDASSDNPTCPGGSGRVRYEEVEGHAQLAEAIHRFRSRTEVRSGRYSANDFNPEAPFSPPLDVGVEGRSNLEVFEYPGRYENREDGESLARIHLQELEMDRTVGEGTGTTPWLQAGYRFELTNHFDPELNRSYVLTRVRHTLRQTSFQGDGGSPEVTYTNEFGCIPDDVPFRPARTSEKPVILGTQTAIVVGKPGEEIWVDDMGRVKVQFHWDRLGRHDENSSCWIRVAHAIAGKGWGAVSIPRIGQEVLVAFLNGDPDRPIIVGGVYNAEQVVPYLLPENQTQTGLKSRSTKSGSQENYNELRFEDAKGKEELVLHAERDHRMVVEHDSSTDVGHDQSESIGNNRTISVTTSDTVSVGGDRSLSIGGNESISVGGNRTVQVAANAISNVGANSAETVSANKVVQAGANISLGSGQAVQIQAGTAISIQCGAAGIQMTSAGLISISGVALFINGAAVLEMAAPLTSIAGTAVMQTGMVNLNSAVWNAMVGKDTIVNGKTVRIN